jgi:hypothetical protein
MLPSERALACELLALYTAEALANAAAGARSPFAAELAAARGAAAAGEPAHALAGGRGEGDGGPVDTLLWLLDAEEEPDLASGGDRAGPDVRAAALARVTPDVYATLAEGPHARLILVRLPRALLLPFGPDCMAHPCLRGGRARGLPQLRLVTRTRWRPAHEETSPQ